MFGLFKKKMKPAIFKGFYWCKGLELKPFQVRASSEAEAMAVLSDQEDFQMICIIKGGTNEIQIENGLKKRSEWNYSV